MTGALVLAVTLAGAVGAGAKQYIGSEACSECHDEQFEHFVSYSKKAKSWHSIEIMASDLTQAEQESCYECHTTGYGKGGFVSIKETPELADVGCETCHGPGAEHAESGGDTEAIERTPSVEGCETCHNADRVEDFNFKPLIFSGAH
ncbi:cytochrome c family protein [Desulfovibrio ferrophilus]|uniref:Cytochrome c family protein n=1 Tax=Desulfovibrio ferrophilus TaxID=241368 RepID=A0A2Z6AZB7_9BACT|nr:cytochrome c family protein [Desulfovibrio ferrophilus]